MAFCQNSTYLTRIGSFALNPTSRSEICLICSGSISASCSWEYRACMICHGPDGSWWINTNPSVTAVKMVMTVCCNRPIRGCMTLGHLRQSVINVASNSGGGQNRRSRVRVRHRQKRKALTAISGPRMARSMTKTTNAELPREIPGVASNSRIRRPTLIARAAPR